MHNGYIFMMQYVKNLEDQLLTDNPRIAVELLREKRTFDDLFEKLYVTTLATRRLSNDYEAAQATIPDQVYGVEWVKTPDSAQEDYFRAANRK